MCAKSKRGKAASAGEVASVPRTALTSRIFQALPRGGIVALVADGGMGKHCAASQVMARARALSWEVRAVRFSAHSLESSYRRLRKACNELVNLAGHDGSCLAVVEDIPELDDSYLVKVSNVIETMAVSGVGVLMLLEPAAELIVEELNCQLILRANDLVVTQEEFPSWADVLPGRTWDKSREATRGVPSLLGALRDTTESMFGHPVGVAWDHESEVMAVRALAPSLIDEEAKLRCAMLALGTGSFEELRSMGIRTSTDMLRQLELDAPILGVSVRDLSFSVYACSPEVAGGVLRAGCRKWPWVVERAADILAERGDMRRAGILALSCPDSVSAERLVERYPVELIDVGLTSLVIRCASKLSAPRFRAAGEALRLVGALPWGQGGEVPMACADGLERPLEGGGRESAHEAMASLQLALLALPHMIRVGDPERPDILVSKVDSLSACASSSGSRLARTLACHARAMLKLYAGTPLEAFRELMLCRELMVGTEASADAAGCGPLSIGAAILRHDFEVVRRVVGDSENPADRKAIRDAVALLDEMAPAAVREQAAYALETSAFIAGSANSVPLAERALARQVLRGETSAQAFGRAVAAFSDCCEARYRRAHIHVREGRRASELAGCVDLPVALGVAERIVATSLGERALLALGSGSPDGCLPDAAAVSGTCPQPPSQDLLALDRLHAAVWGAADEAPEVVATSLAGLSPKTTTVALAGVIGRADRSRGVMFMRSLPAAWRGRTVIAASGGTIVGASALPMASHPYQPDGGGSRRPGLKVTVLGGFGVTVSGRRLPESAWRRRHARTLLAMLVLTPGHNIARFEAAECFWPESDYARCRSGMYTVVSSLRGTLGQVGAGGYVRGEMGRLWLDPQVVSCDIDEFEEIGRVVVGQSVDDARLVKLCTRMEEMYQGGTALVTTDSSGFFRKRHNEVSRRFVDALLVGVGAAVRIGDSRQAVWFAETARAESPQREDVASVLAWARGVDAREASDDEGLADEAA